MSQALNAIADLYVRENRSGQRTVRFKDSVEGFLGLSPAGLYKQGREGVVNRALECSQDPFQCCNGVQGVFALLEFIPGYA